MVLCPLRPAADITAQLLTAGLCHNRTNAVQQKSPLFDHLVGAAEQRERDGKAERLGGFHIDNQLDFRGLLYWQFSGLVALENAAGVDTDQTVCVRNSAAIAQQDASRGKLAN